MLNFDRTLSTNLSDGLFFRQRKYMKKKGGHWIVYHLLSMDRSLDD